MTSKELYLRLLSYVKPYWKIFAIALLAMAGFSLEISNKIYLKIQIPRDFSKNF